jgi:hypothetical protein
MRLGKESTHHNFCEVILTEAKQTFADAADTPNLTLWAGFTAMVQIVNNYLSGWKT